MEGCIWNIPFILVIVGDNLLATISLGANLHHSPRTDSASLVCSAWKSGGFSPLFHLDSWKCSAGLLPLGTSVGL